MAKKYIGGMPREIDMGGGWHVVFAAFDATTGAAVSGVKISNAVLDVETDASPSELESGPLPLPVFVPIPDTENA